MKDFQRGWYWHLILQMTRSKPLGYLPFDGQLWTLAGSYSRQYWEGVDEDQKRPRYALVLDCFKVAEFDGRKWIYNQPLLKVLTEQQHKHDKAVQRGELGAKRKNSLSKSSLNSYSEEFQTVWETHNWNPVSKKTAAKAFEKALQDIQDDKRCTRDEAICFLAGAMEEFKTSDAGRVDGLFAGYQPPYPATWLNGQRYLDDRTKWQRPPEGHTTESGQVIGRGYTPPPKKKKEDE